MVGLKVEDALFMVPSVLRSIPVFRKCIASAVALLEMCALLRNVRSVPNIQWTL